jgi:hypothetical protein
MSLRIASKHSSAGALCHVLLPRHISLSPSRVFKIKHNSSSHNAQWGPQEKNFPHSPRSTFRLLLASHVLRLIFDPKHRVSQEKRSIFWEVIILVILIKKLYMYMCPIPNGFRDKSYFTVQFQKF